MPLLLLSFLRRLRLPSRGEVELAGVVVIVGLLAYTGRLRERVAARDAALAARPTVEERVQLVRVEAPVRVVEKIVRGADGACSIERTTERGAVTTTTDSARKETPACLPAAAVKTWALGGGLDLRRRDRGNVGLSKSFGDLTLGLGHAWGGDARLGDVSGNLSIKVF